MSTKNCELIAKDFSLQEVITAGKRFIIPYYQRPYAWGAVEVGQLLQDIHESSTSSREKEYYVGNIVCNADALYGDNCLKVIDGQQRLTTLFLLQATLERRPDVVSEGKMSSLLVNETTSRLTYLAREEDNIELLDYFKKKKDDFAHSFAHSGFETARQIMEEFCNEKFNDTTECKNFHKYLIEKVKFVLVELPKKNFDHAEYFEVINTNVKQLEKHEVLKALMLSKIDDTETRKCCAAVWDACSQMDQRIDYRSNKLKEVVYKLCDPETKNSSRDDLIDEAFKTFQPDQSVADQNVTLDKLLEDDYNQERGKHATGIDSEGRVGSIVNFSIFLLLVFALENKGKGSLDDRKILETIWDQAFKETKETDKCAEEFIKQLLYWRILFDSYIIKGVRENSDKIRWLIRPLKRESDGYAPDDKDYDPEFRMLQALLHVSGCPKDVWLLPLMKKLSELRMCDDVKKELARIELNYRRERILSKDLHSGLSTPRYALFALDYELWKKHNESDIISVVDRKYRPKTNFVFRFRNSVEHVYPQNPKTAEGWESKDLNGFGNLALISQSSNSSYNCQMPENKRHDFAKNEEIESLKLLYIYDDDHFQEWQEDKGSKHGNEMIEILLDSFPDKPDYHDVREWLRGLIRAEHVETKQ